MAILQDLHVNSVFVPFAQSRNKHNKTPSLNWLVTLTYQGRDVLTTDYMAGCGHCPGNKLALPENSKGLRSSIIGVECQEGFKQRLGLGKTFYSYRKGGYLTPNEKDVIHALFSDSDVLNYADHTDWCDNTGYDADSINVRRIYRQCMETALKLRAAIGEEGVQELSREFEDY